MKTLLEFEYIPDPTPIDFHHKYLRRFVEDVLCNMKCVPANTELKTLSLLEAIGVHGYPSRILIEIPCEPSTRFMALLRYVEKHPKETIKLFKTTSITLISLKATFIEDTSITIATNATTS